MKKRKTTAAQSPEDVDTISPVHTELRTPSLFRRRPMTMGPNIGTFHRMDCPGVELLTEYHRPTTLGGMLLECHVMAMGSGWRKILRKTMTVGAFIRLTYGTTRPHQSVRKRLMETFGIPMESWDLAMKVNREGTRMIPLSEWLTAVYDPSLDELSFSNCAVSVKVPRTHLNTDHGPRRTQAIYDHVNTTATHTTKEAAPATARSNAEGSGVGGSSQRVSGSSNEVCQRIWVSSERASEDPEDNG